MAVKVPPNAYTYYSRGDRTWSGYLKLPGGRNFALVVVQVTVWYGPIIRTAPKNAVIHIQSHLTTSQNYPSKFLKGMTSVDLDVTIEASLFGGFSLIVFSVFFGTLKRCTQGERLWTKKSGYGTLFGYCKMRKEFIPNLKYGWGFL